jgi:hypothetical protein
MKMLIMSMGQQWEMMRKGMVVITKILLDMTMPEKMPDIVKKMKMPDKVKMIKMPDMVKKINMPDMVAVKRSRCRRRWNTVR